VRHAFFGGIRMQLRTSLRRWDDLQVLVLVPLSTLLFLTTFNQAHRPELAISGVLAAYVVAVWSLALVAGGDLVEDERYFGTFAALLVTPVSVERALLGRVVAISGLGLVALVESAVTATVGFGVPLRVRQPVLFAVGLFLLFVAVAGVAYFFAAGFVLAYNARSWQNALTYPAYVLGGVLAPLRHWPVWVQVLGRCFFLSWTMDLFRRAISPPSGVQPVVGIGAVVVLGGLTWLAGVAMLRRSIRHLQRTGRFDDA
jgi:ABC-2 type transport system permease protein